MFCRLIQGIRMSTNRLENNLFRFLTNRIWIVKSKKRHLLFLSLLSLIVFGCENLSLDSSISDRLDLNVSKEDPSDLMGGGGSDEMGGTTLKGGQSVGGQGGGSIGGHVLL